ncbi:MAG: type I restriction-modification system subunit M [Chromatiales bacterium]|nr:SAM-dependent DNA methyltransferase [Gammaproteobacteria bacterium]
MEQKNLGSFIWSVAELLRGDFKQSEYGLVILPFTVLRRFECVLEPTRNAVLEQYEETHGMNIDPDLVLPGVSGQQFYNTSRYQLNNLGVADTLANLEDYINKFSANARAVFEQFEFSNKLLRLEDDKLLYKVAQHFAGIDLHPDVVSNHEMGLAFEHLIRTFAESANDTAGEFYTPRDVVRLATTLVFSHDSDALKGEGVIRSIYDPACGTGGFLSSGIEQIHEWNEEARVVPFGQELNAQTHAIAVADMMIKDFDASNIKLGNTLSDDLLYAERFDYCLANPPFGVDWKKVQEAVQAEAAKSDRGRFVPGLPRVSDGSLLFLMHLLSKMRTDGPSRIGIVLNGSPLFTGGAGSGESEIRRWILENDWLEAIIALPTDMFYNTGIATYIWVLSNRKDKQRKKKIQLINASGESFWKAMRKSLGSKRRYLPEESLAEIARLYAAFETDDLSKVFDATDFGYRRITVERPLQLSFYPKDKTRRAALTEDKPWARWTDDRQDEISKALDHCEDKFTDRKEFVAALPKLKPAELKLLQKHLGEHDETAEYCRDKKGNSEPNPDLRDNENVPLLENINDYFQREVIPHVPDAWVDTGKRDALDGEVGIVGYEIPFNRHFYQYVPPRSLEEIDADLDKVSAEIMELLQEVHV